MEGTLAGCFTVAWPRSHDCHPVKANTLAKWQAEQEEPFYRAFSRAGRLSSPRRSGFQMNIAALPVESVLDCHLNKTTNLLKTNRSPELAPFPPAARPANISIGSLGRFPPWCLSTELLGDVRELKATSKHKHTRPYRKATANSLTCIRWNSSSERACDIAMFTWEAS